MPADGFAPVVAGNTYTHRHGENNMPDESLVRRFWAKVNKAGPVPAYRPDLGPCWLWTASTQISGYGRIYRDGSLDMAHRVSFEIAFGFPAGDLEVDHLCRVHGCVNPQHLELVTRRENVLRGTSPMAVQAKQTACLRGHRFDEKNTYSRAATPRQRKCRTCHAAQEYARRHGISIERALEIRSA